MGTTPAAIGDGYRNQLAAMEEGERQKSLLMQRYADAVGSPARAKQLQDEMMANNMVQSSQNMQNERFMMAQQYQSRLREEHKNMLQSQIDQERRAKMAMEQARKQDEAMRAQQAGLFHLQVEQQKRDQKS